LVSVARVLEHGDEQTRRVLRHLSAAGFTSTISSSSTALITVTRASTPSILGQALLDPRGRSLRVGGRRREHDVAARSAAVRTLREAEALDEARAGRPSRRASPCRR
jgi:hypothetical protein